MAYGTNFYAQNNTNPMGGNDRFGNAAITDSGDQTNLVFTNSRAAVTDDVTFTNGVLNFWNRTVENSDATANNLQTGATNGNHINWWNCQFNLDNLNGSLTATNQGAGFGNVDITGAVQAGGRGWNLYNCYVSLFGTATGSGYVFDDLIDSTIQYDNGNANAFYGGTYSKGGARLRNSTIFIPTIPGNTNRFGEHAFRDVPAEIRNMVFYNTRLAQGAFTDSLLIEAPDFPVTTQPQFFGLQATNNPVLGNKGWVVVGPYLWSAVSATNAADSPFASRITFGGGGAVFTNGQHFMQCYGYRPTFYNDPQATVAAQGINVYVSTNMRVNNFISTDLRVRIQPPNFTVNSSHMNINKFVSNNNGQLVSSQRSTDGGSTFANGFINWPQIALSNTVDESSLFTNANSQSLEDHTVASPIQLAIKNGTGNNGPQPMIGQVGIETTIDIRGYAYVGQGDVTTHSEASLGPLSGSNAIEVVDVVEALNPVVKSTNLVSTDLASNTNLNMRFPTTENSTVTLNDVHDAARWLWSDYQTDLPPTVTSGIAALRRTSTVDFDVAIQDNTFTAPYSRVGDVINIRADGGITLGLSEIVTGLRVRNYALNSTVPTSVIIQASGNITGPQTAPGLIATENLQSQASFRDCDLSGNIQVPLLGTADLYVSFVQCEILPGQTLNVEQTGGGSGTVIVQNAPVGTTFSGGARAAPIRLANFVNNTGDTVYYAYRPVASTTGPVVTGTIPNNGNFEITNETLYDGSALLSGTSTRFRFTRSGFNENASQIQPITLANNAPDVNLTTLLDVAGASNSNALNGGTFTPIVNLAAVSSRTFIYTPTGTTTANTYLAPSDRLVSNVGQAKLFVEVDATAMGAISENNEIQTISALYSLKNSVAYAEVCLRANLVDIITALDGTTPAIDDTRIVLIPRQFAGAYVSGVVNNITGAYIANISASLTDFLEDTIATTTLDLQAPSGVSLITLDDGSGFPNSGVGRIGPSNDVFTWSNRNINILSGIPTSGSDSIESTFAAGVSVTAVTRVSATVANRQSGTGISSGSLTVAANDIVNRVNTNTDTEVSASQTTLTGIINTGFEEI